MAGEIWDAALPRFGAQPEGMDALQQRVTLKLIEKTRESMEGWHSPLPRLALALIGPYAPKGESAERTRVWDSCYSVDYSHIHGGSIRPTGRSRYRQWLTHKFGTWHDQFGSSGCVGCGRCITWCPVGIDVTEELTAIRATDGADGND